MVTIIIDGRTALDAAPPLRCLLIAATPEGRLCERPMDVGNGGMGI